jgi:Carbohydrate esterase 2 N-terminal/GDSL-like Lipase/Acylhydrolase family
MSLAAARRAAWLGTIAGAVALFVGCASEPSGTEPAAGNASVAGMTAAGQASVAGFSGSTSAGTGGVAMGGQAGDGTSAAGVGGSAAGVGGNMPGVGGNLAGAGGQGGAPVMLEPGLRWLGRVDKTATGARFSWPGAGFTARFNGTSAKVSMKTDNADYFQLVVDGTVSLLTTQSGQHDYDLAQNLAAGEHTVTLWRRTEANYGSVEVTKVDFVGELLSPPPPSNKRLEVIGDSITVGFGVECKTQNEQFSYATENNYQTYEAIAARDLGAEVHTMAWSGIGVWRDVGGGMMTQMPQRYLRTLGNEDNSTWDFTLYTPGAVVVLLGTNDFAGSDPGQPFLNAYKAFVHDIRGRYPQARIYLAHSPMLAGARGTALAGYLDQVKAAQAGAGDTNVGILDFQPPAADAWGCGHPNGATHLIMSGVLKTALQTDLGW